MTAATRKKLPLIVFFVTTAIAVAIAVVTLLFLNPPQCPSGVSSQNSNCVIGANIGLGLYLFLAVGVWVLGNVAALILALRSVFMHHGLSKRQRAIRGILLISITALVTYAVAAFFLGHIHYLIRS